MLPIGEWGEHSQSRSAQASLKKTLVLSLSDLVLTDASAWSLVSDLCQTFPCSVPLLSLLATATPSLLSSFPPTPSQPLNKLVNLAKCFLHQAVFSNTSVTNGSRTDQISYVCFQNPGNIFQIMPFFPFFRHIINLLTILGLCSVRRQALLSGSCRRLGMQSCGEVAAGGRPPVSSLMTQSLAVLMLQRSRACCPVRTYGWDACRLQLKKLRQKTSQGEGSLCVV